MIDEQKNRFGRKISRNEGNRNVDNLTRVAKEARDVYYRIGQCRAKRYCYGIVGWPRNENRTV